MKNIVNLIVVLSIAFSSFIPQHPMAVAGYGLNRASGEDATPEPTATSEPIMTDTPEIIQPTELTPTEVATEIQPNPTSPEPYSTETPANPVEEATPTLEETPIPTIELTPTETPAEITETPEAGLFVDDYDWASDKFSDSFALRMTPPLLRTGETVALHWNIRNFDELTGSSLAIEISYPQELNPETSPEYITGENLIRIENPAATGKISFTVLAEASYAEISAVLYLDGQRYDANQAALASPQTTSPDQKMVYESFNERSSLEVPAEAAEVPLDIISIPLIDARAGEIGASAQAMEFLAYDSAGNTVHTFDEPVTITIHYNEALIEGYESGVYLSYFDEQNMQWTDVPADLDTDADTISASVTHFSIYDINVDDYWLSPVMALPDMAQVSNFTGAGTYSYPIEVPESPAGLKPDLSLTYNSQIVDSANAFSQADWTGMGWSLTIPYIYADLHDMDDSKDDQYYIIINGRREALLQAWDSTIQFGNNETGTVYHTRLESYWKIIQHNKENFKPWWEVIDQKGNTYYFGEAGIAITSQQSQYISTHCSTSGQTPIYRWSLNRVKNIFGKELRYTYIEKQLPVNGCTLDYGVYPSQIIYPNNNYRVVFSYNFDRNDFRNHWTGHAFTYDDGRLTNIQIQMDTAHEDFSGARTIYQYNFYYSMDNMAGLITTPIFPNYNWDGHEGYKTLTLAGIQEVSYDSNGAASYLPVTKFKYQDDMHLTEVDNGYGATVSFTYAPWHLDPSKINNYYPEIWMWELGQNNVWVTSGTTQYLKINNPDPNYDFKNYFGSYYYIKVDAVQLTTGETVMMYLGLDDGTGNITNSSGSSGFDQVPLSPSNRSISFVYRLSAEARPRNSQFVFQCRVGNRNCGIENTWVRRLPTYYRVTAKTLTDAVTEKSYTYTYSYLNGTSDTGSINDDISNINALSNKPNDYIDTPFTVFRGNGMVTETLPDGRRNVTEYVQFNKDHPSEGDLHLNGTIQSIKVYDGNLLLTETKNDYQEDKIREYKADKRIFGVRLTETENKTYASNGSSYTATKTYYSYDVARQGGTQHGNVTNVVESRWNGSNFVDYRMTSSYFYPKVDGNSNLSAFPAYKNIYRCPSGSINGACFAGGTTNPDAQTYVQFSIWYLYDNNSTYTLAPTTGVLTGTRTITGWVNNEPYYKDVKFTYDSWGNLIQEDHYRTENMFSAYAAGPAETTYTCYGTANYPNDCVGDGVHTYPLWQKNALGQVTSASYDYAIGLPTQITDANGNSTLYQFDSFGRVIKVAKPGNTLSSPSISYTYVDSIPFGIIQTQRISHINTINSGVPSSTVSTTRNFFDGLGRLIQSQAANIQLSSGLKDVLTDYEYDHNDQVIKQTVPYEVSPSSGYRPQQLTSQPVTITAYDIFGRTLNVLRTDGVIDSSIAYNGLVTSVTDANGQTTVQTQDEWGRITEVRPPTGPKTRYEYDAADNLTAARQYENAGTASFAATTMAYNLANEKLTMNDPDMGVWQYRYDGVGNLIRQTDARGQSICLYYDQLNRLTGKYYTTAAACPTGTNINVNVQYVYDTGPNGIGHRTEMHDLSGGTTWTYDNRGRMTSEVKTITGSGTFKTMWWYNDADLVESVFYPADNTGAVGESVLYIYNNLSAVDMVLGSNYDYLGKAHYDSSGRVESLELGGSGSSASIFQDYTYYGWSEAVSNIGQGSRLKEIKAGTPAAPASLTDFVYDYDYAGNIVTINDFVTGSPQTQTFTYDSINRLLSAQTISGSLGNYSQSYSYDAKGRLLNGTNTYSDSGSHLHAVIGRSTTQSYWYDANGNLTRQKLETAFKNQYYVYNAENQLIQDYKQRQDCVYTNPGGPGGPVVLSSPAQPALKIRASLNAVTIPCSPPGKLTIVTYDNNTYVYDGDGNRVKVTSGGTTTVYIGNYFEWSGSTSTMKKYYYAGSTRIAERVGSSTDAAGVYFLLSDHLGSTTVAATASGAQASKQLYSAFGASRYTSGSLPTSFKYTGQRADSLSGLYYYNARYYDPATGRFIQPDSIVPQPYNPSAWDRYAYVNNNPINRVDPTGHFACGDGINDPRCDQYDPDEGTLPQTPNALDYNAWDLVPIVSNIRGIVRGTQTASWSVKQPGFMEEQKAYQTWINNCYGVCHGSSPEPGSLSGGPMPDVPLVDSYSQGAGEAGGNAMSLLIDASYAMATTNIFAYGGKSWHVGWQTNDEWSIIHVGNAPNPKWGGIHFAIGSVGPRQAFFHIYIYPNPHIFINWPK